MATTELRGRRLVGKKKKEKTGAEKRVDEERMRARWVDEKESELNDRVNNIGQKSPAKVFFSNLPLAPFMLLSPPQYLWVLVGMKNSISWQQVTSRPCET
jgi:hypothetical protein